MNRTTTRFFVGAGAWLLAAGTVSQTLAADAPAKANAPAAASTPGTESKAAPPPLVLVPEPRLAPYVPAPAKAAPSASPAMPSAAAAAPVVLPPSAPPASYAAPYTPRFEVLPPMPSGRSHTVVRGENLDRVIQKTMADSPLKPEFIRPAFVQLNPQAFPNGRVTALRPGTVLLVPDSAQLLRNVLLPVLEGAEAAAVLRSGVPSAADERRRWVRFP